MSYSAKPKHDHVVNTSVKGLSIGSTRRASDFNYATLKTRLTRFVAKLTLNRYNKSVVAIGQLIARKSGFA